MKRVNIKCPYCGSQAFLRPASVVRGQECAEPGAEVYVCAKYPVCDAEAHIAKFSELRCQQVMQLCKKFLSAHKHAA